MRNLPDLFIVLLAVCVAGCQAPNPKGGLVGEIPKRDSLSSFVVADSVSGMQLEDRVWMLTELGGRAVDISDFPEPPSLQFRSEDRKFFCKTDCNGIAGDYRLTKRGSLEFLEIAHTEMACQNMEVERQLLIYLPQVEKYRIEKVQLALLSADDAVLAIYRLQE